jgi:hypothetical protein
MNMNVLLRKPICSRCSIIGLAALVLVLLAGTIHALPAQSNPEGTVSAAPAGAPADKTSKEEKPQAQAAASKPAASGEGFKLGAYDGRTDFEVGYRWSSKIDGNQEMYRSQVNQFQGARLFNAALSLRSTPGTGWFDKLDLSANNVGDPYSSVRFNMSRMDAYQIQFSYRDLKYYNYISSFANPLLSAGNPFPQHNLDVNYKIINFELRLRPNSKITPYFGYARNSGIGPGYTTMGTAGNEFLLHTQWDYSSDEYRAGVQFNLSMLNLTVEQGYRRMKNRTTLIDAGQPTGNRSFPLFGQNVTLDSLDRSYNGFTGLPTTKVLAKFTPFKNLRMTGQYIYSMGKLDSNMSELSTGHFVSFEELLAYGAELDSWNGRAKKPNHNGSILFEYSPFSRLMLTDRIDTLAYHVSGAALLSTSYLDANSLLGPGPTSDVTVTSLLNAELVYNQVRNQAEGEFDLGHGISMRAGHRYTFTDISNNDSEDAQTSEMSQNTAIFGLVFRPTRMVRLGVDYENTQSNQALTRTDLFDYDDFNFDMRIGSWKGFTVNSRVGIRRNSNDASDITFRSRNWNFIGGLSWEPNERISLNADFSRTDLLSTIPYLIPQNFRKDISLFDERVSGFGGGMSIGIYRGSKVELGYRGIISRGSNPLEFHQPYMSVLIPMGHGMAFKPAWQYYGYSEKLFPMENYKAHLMTFSLVYSR